MDVRVRFFLSQYSTDSASFLPCVRSCFYAITRLADRRRHDTVAAY